jgi:hypothetical protein
MAITQVPVASPSGIFIFTDTAIGATADAIKASSALLNYITVDNSANGGAASYVKLYNLAAGSVVVGTTAPDEIIYVPAGVKIAHILYTGSILGKTFGTALSAACVTTGGTAGSTPPVSSVVMTANYI